MNTFFLTQNKYITNIHDKHQISNPKHFSVLSWNKFVTNINNNRNVKNNEVTAAKILALIVLTPIVMRVQ